MDGDSDALTTMQMIKKTKDTYRSRSALSYDDENPDDEKNEVEAYDAEISNHSGQEKMWISTSDDGFSDGDMKPARIRVSY